MAHVEFDLGDREIPELRLTIPRHLADIALRQNRRREKEYSLMYRLSRLIQCNIASYSNVQGERKTRLTIHSTEIGLIKNELAKARMMKLLIPTLANFATRTTQRRGSEPPLEITTLCPDGMFGAEAIIEANVTIPELEEYLSLEKRVAEVMRAMAHALGASTSDSSIDATVNRQGGVWLSGPGSMNTDLDTYDPNDGRVKIMDNNVGYDTEVLVHLAGLTIIAQANRVA